MALNVTIIVPRYIKFFGEFYAFPLGIAYVASAIKQAGYNCTALNLNHEFGNPYELVYKHIKSNKVNVCFSGGLSPFLPMINEAFCAARAANSSIVNIAGGGVVSSDPLIALDLMNIDFGIIGEGEVSAVELLSSINHGTPKKDVNGIVFRNSRGKAIKTPDSKPVMDLGKLAWPEYELLGFREHLKNQNALDDYFLHTVDKGIKPRSIDMISSRSCPYSCTFCFHPTGKVYRERSLDEFFAELSYLKKKFDINMVNLVDELFSLRKKRLIEFCERIKPYNLKWIVQLHVHSADPEILELMRESGCTYISYGVESMSQSVLHSMQKKAKPQKIDETLKTTFNSKIGIQGNLIFFDTVETLDTANETMAWWADNRRYQVYLSRLQVFPGSPDYIMANRDGLIEDRVKFSQELPPNFNISNINDLNYDNITFQLMVHGASLLIPPKNQNISACKTSISNRGKAFNICFQCNGCNHTSVYRKVFLRPEQVNFIRLTCQNCRCRVDIKNDIMDKDYHGLELSVRNKQLSRQKNQGFMRKQNAKLWHNLVRNFDFTQVNKADKGFLTNLRSVGEKLKQDPYSVPLQIEFGICLVFLKQYGAAMLHFKQALLFDSYNGTAKRCIRELKEKADFHKYKFKFFRSVTDQEPTYRKSRIEGRPYNRKEEPGFPTYTRSENRVSLKRDRLPIFFQR